MDTAFFSANTRNPASEFTFSISSSSDLGWVRMQSERERAKYRAGICLTRIVFTKIQLLQLSGFSKGLNTSTKARIKLLHTFVKLCFIGF